MARRITKDHLAAAARVGSFCAVHFLIDGKTVAKTGENTRLAAEANTMRFIRENTNIPVPEVYDAYTHDETGHVCIVMEKVEGQTLQEAWPSYDDADKETVVQQLRGYFNELRRSKSPTISCTDGSPCDDQYFDDDIGGYGPYSTEEDFNQGLVRAWTRGREGDTFIRFLCKTLLHMMQGHESYFSPISAHLSKTSNEKGQLLHGYDPTTKPNKRASLTKDLSITQTEHMTGQEH
ncbi:phosphotransferase enzyme family protein, partial [Metarhizium majus ARSEF 297]